MKDKHEPRWLTPGALELLCIKDWPAKEVADFCGWSVFATQGRSGRVNSVWPLSWEASRTHTPEAGIAFCEHFYAQRGLKPMFKLADDVVRPRELPSALERAGYAPQNETLVMTRLLTDVPAPAHAVRLDLDMTPAFLDVLRTAAPSPEDFAERHDIIARMDDKTTFAMIEIDGQPAAIGLARHSAFMGGLYLMRTAPNMRRRGLARDVVRALCRSSYAHGAVGAFLQVEKSNTAAVALYQSEGFTPLYSYWYWTKA